MVEFNGLTPHPVPVSRARIAELKVRLVIEMAITAGIKWRGENHRLGHQDRIA